MIQTTYRKKNGEIIQRLTNTTDYRIGEFNSYGWEIVNVQYEYKNNFYSKKEYDILIDRDWKRQRQLNIIRLKIDNVYRQIKFAVELLIIYEFIQMLSNIIAK